MTKQEREFSRRQILSGGLALGFVFGAPGFVTKAHAQAELASPSDLTAADALPDTQGMFGPNAFIRIPAQGPIILILPNIEMGQGTHTAEAMLLAEELDVALDQVKAFDAPADEALYGNPALQAQATGGSTSVMSNWISLREAGATARQMLVAAAAQSWGVNVNSCTTENGRVNHAASGRSAPYGALIQLAASGPVPSRIALKDPKEFKLVGKGAPRIDTPAKVNGSAVFGIDVKVPGMRIATVMKCPVFGGKLRSVDETAARAIPGVSDVLKIEDAVAVVADNYWTALQGIKALDVFWDEGIYATLSSEDVYRDLKQASVTAKPLSVVSKGNVDQGLAVASKTLKAEYISPFLSHSPMEPINCTMHVRPDGADIWVGTQVPGFAQASAANVLGLKPEQVVVHNHYMGGAFGRRLFVDSIEQTAKFAKQVPYPLKIVWSREEDIMHDLYRPGYYDRVEAGMTSDGQMTAFRMVIAGGSVTSVFVPGGLPMGTVDPDLAADVSNLAYDIPAQSIGWVRQDTPVPIGYWRGVGPGRSFFIIESFIDECAHSFGVDPVKYRQGLLANSPRALAVVNLAAEKSGWWDKPLPKGRGRGIAFHNGFGSYTASVLEVEIDETGELRLIHAVLAVDCGHAVNPDAVIAQAQGGFVFGLSAALYSGITFKNGRAEQSNFNDYRILRINEMPTIEVHRIESTENPGGMGECATVSAPPTLANAIFAATGVRQRFMPVDRAALASHKISGKGGAL